MWYDPETPPEHFSKILQVRIVAFDYISARIEILKEMF